MTYTESTLETTTLSRLADLNYEHLSWPEITGEGKLRASHQDVVLEPKLREALTKINKDASADTITEATKKLVNLSGTKLVTTNEQFHDYLINGIDIETRGQDGNIKTKKIRVINFRTPRSNNFCAVSQLTIVEWKHTRRPDIVLYVNGLPLVVIELKNLTDAKTTIKSAYNQIQTYKKEIPNLFHYNELCIISDGVGSRIGSLTANFDRYMKRKSIDGETVASQVRQLETTIKGACEPTRLLDIIENFIVFQKFDDDTVKILAAYHQYFAVKKAITSTMDAVNLEHRKAGVVRHTQGSGKSLSMVFYAWEIIKELNNPTLVIITDRNDLDEQLFSTFSKSIWLIRQHPQQAKSTTHLKELLSVASGGVVFTTIQKFTEDDGSGSLSERGNIVVIADEAHRSQYGFKGKVKNDTWEIQYGFAKYMRDALPNASFIGFTGTPIEFTDKNTKTVFWEYIDVYDISRAIEDGATVPIYYEARLAKINLLESEVPHLDEQFEELTEQEEQTNKDKLKSKRARLEAMVGSDKRLSLVAKDIVEHFGSRTGVIDGKGMIVSMSRRIAVDLYAKIIEQRPDRHSDDIDKWTIKVVMTGSAADPESFQQHVTKKSEREYLAKRVKDPKDPLKLVIVRDMRLTGFDAPSMHTMYIDKPMQGHGLMQAIARVNRVYKDKQGGLIVDYLGIANELKQALAYYTQDGDKKQATIPIEEVVVVMKEKYEIVKDLFHDFDYQNYFTAEARDRTETLSLAMEYILGVESWKDRLLKAVTNLSHAFSIVIPHDEAVAIRDEVAFFQAIKVWLMKFDEDIQSEWKATSNYDQAIRQIVSGAISSDEVVDIFKTTGVDKQEVSILSEEFLDEVQNMKHKNLAFELLKKLLNDNIKSLQKKNLVQSRSFSEMLEWTIKRYQNRTIESAEVIAELIELAKHIKEEQEKWNDLWLQENEKAFYDALVMNESAVKELWDEILKAMAHELLQIIRENASIDRTLRSDVQAKLRVLVKRLLKKYKYPPDFEEKAIDTVLKQAELACVDHMK